MIYGANGYTGRLIIEEAIKKGHQPILAGRNSEKLTSLAQKYDLPYQVFDLKSVDAIQENLKGVHTLLHCAGPFSATHKPMLKACLRAKTNYLDITGEIPIFEKVQHKKNEIAKAGIVAIPGVGFDVVPSDCLAAQLKSELPDATQLQFAFLFAGKISKGTLKTVIEGLPAGGVVREEGKFKWVPAASKIKEVRFDKKSVFCVCMPWGDVSTAFHSTGIPNIEVYMAFPKAMVGALKLSRYVSLLFAVKPVQKGLQTLVEKFHREESKEEFESARVAVWAQVTNDKGISIEKRLFAKNGYQLTAQTAVAAVEKVLSGAVQPGAYTPSCAFGKDFIQQFEDIRVV